MSAPAGLPTTPSVALPPHLQRQIWRGDQLGGAARGSMPSGHAALDRELPGGGWPRGALTEVLAAQPGAGEMRLLAPVLRAVTAEAGLHALLVAPPYMPYAPALAAWGVALERVTWVRCAEADALWATEQGLKHAGVGMVLAWLPRVRAEALRRLQVAAQDGAALGFLVRPLRAARQSSPAPLRLVCTPASRADGTETLAGRPAVAAVRIDIIKRRGPVSTSPLLLHLPLSPPPTELDLDHHHVMDRRGTAVVTAGSSAAAVALGR